MSFSNRYLSVIDILPLDDELTRAIHQSYLRTYHLRLTMEDIFKPGKTTGTLIDELIRSRGVAADGKLVSWAEVNQALNEDPPRLIEAEPLTYRLLGTLIDKAQGRELADGEEPSISRQRVSAWVTQGVRPDERIRAVLWDIFGVLPEEQSLYDQARSGPSANQRSNARSVGR